MISIVMLHLLSTFSLSQALLAHMSPLVLMALRMLFGASIVMSIVLIKRISLNIQKIHWLDFGKAIIFASLLPYYLRYWALSTGDSNISYWYFSGLVITYLLSLLYNLEQHSWIKNILICISYGALFFVIGFPKISFGMPECAFIASVISFTYGWITIRKLIVEYEYPPLVVNGIMLASAGLVCLIICSVSEPLIIKGDWQQCALLIAAVILISNVMVHTWYMALLKQYSLTFIQLCSFIIPCWKLLYSGNYTLMQVLGILIILICMGMFYYFEHYYLLDKKSSTTHDFY
jgi:EamA-like transporter family protein